MIVAPCLSLFSPPFATRRPRVESLLVHPDSKELTQFLQRTLPYEHLVGYEELRNKFHLFALQHFGATANMVKRKKKRGQFPVPSLFACIQAS